MTLIAEADDRGLRRQPAPAADDGQPPTDTDCGPAQTADAVTSMRTQ